MKSEIGKELQMEHFTFDSKRLRADITLGKMNIFIGHNGSGKSSLMKAIKLMSEIERSYLFFDMLMEHEEKEYRKVLMNTYGDCTISYNAIQWDGKNNQLSLDKPDGEISTPNSVTYIPSNKAMATYVDGEFAQGFDTDDFFREFYEKLSYNTQEIPILYGAMGKLKWQERGYHRELVVMDEDGEHKICDVPYSLKCLIPILVLVANHRESTLFIEKPEMGLDPHSQRLFVNWLLDYHKTNKYFMSTDSHTILNTLLERKDVDANVIVLHPDGERSYSAVNIGEEGKKDILEKGIDPFINAEWFKKEK